MYYLKTCTRLRRIHVHTFTVYMFGLDQILAPLYLIQNGAANYSAQNERRNIKADHNFPGIVDSFLFGFPIFFLDLFSSYGSLKEYLKFCYVKSINVQRFFIFFLFCKNTDCLLYLQYCLHWERAVGRTRTGPTYADSVRLRGSSLQNRIP